jgi:hypothetical protein
LVAQLRYKKIQKRGAVKVLAWLAGSGCPVDIVFGNRIDSAP